MSVSEAVSLIIQAAALTEGGDLFMLDMGQRIRIDDLARRLIRLRGLRPQPGGGAEEQRSRGDLSPAPQHPSTLAPPHPGTGDIPIVYTGVRPGEKMHEELLGDGEIREPTSHPHIFRVRNSQRETPALSGVEGCNACPEPEPALSPSKGRRMKRETLDELIALALWNTYSTGLAEAQRNGELMRRLWEVIGPSRPRRGRLPC